MKHVLFAIATIATLSAQAGQPSRLQADNNKKYNTYALYESDVKSVSILVDYKMVKTDCHGLNSKYTVTKVTDGQYLVTKDMLAHALFVCPVSMAGKELQDGVKIQIPADKYHSAYVTVIAPDDSEVLAEVTK